MKRISTMLLLLSLCLASCGKKQEASTTICNVASNSTSSDRIKGYIKEKDYPKAISALRANTGYKNAKTLMREVRYMMEASFISCDYTYVAAINQNKGVNAVLGDYGFDTDVTEWSNVTYLLNEDEKLSAITEEYNVYTTTEECKIDIERLESGTNIEKIVQSGFKNDYIGLKSDGTIVYQSNRFDGRQQNALNSWAGIVDVEAGTYVYGLTSDGKVLCSDSESSIGSELASWKDIIAISASLDTIVGLKKDGTVVVATEKEYGSNDTSSWTDIVAVDTCGYYTIGLKSDGTLVHTEYDNDGLELAKASEFTNLYIPSINVE